MPKPGAFTPTVLRAVSLGTTANTDIGRLQGFRASVTGPGHLLVRTSGMEAGTSVEIHFPAAGVYYESMEILEAWLPGADAVPLEPASTIIGLG